MSLCLIQIHNETAEQNWSIFKNQLVALQKIKYSVQWYLVNLDFRFYCVFLQRDKELSIIGLC